LQAVKSTYGSTKKIAAWPHHSQPGIWVNMQPSENRREMRLNSAFTELAVAATPIEQMQVIQELHRDVGRVWFGGLAKSEQRG